MVSAGDCELLSELLHTAAKAETTDWTARNTAFLCEKYKPVTLQKELMKTVPLTPEQLDHLLTVLDYVLTTEATSYEEWCDMGNNPEQHVWFYAADAVNALSGETV